VYPTLVTDLGRALRREVLALPAPARASLAAELLASLEEAPPEDTAGIRQAWVDEIERRARHVLDEGSSGEEWHRLRERIGDRLKRR
jgi:hypothetical protein